MRKLCGCNSVADHREWKRGVKRLRCLVLEAESKGQRDQRAKGLCWNLAAIGSIKYAPEDQIAGNVLELMLDPRGHEQDVA